MEYDIFMPLKHHNLYMWANVKPLKFFELTVLPFLYSIGSCVLAGLGAGSNVLAVEKDRWHTPSFT